MYSEMLQKAIDLLKNETRMVMISKEGEIVIEENRGILPMFRAVTKHKELCKNAVIADIVIGKAAALLAAYGKVFSVYGRYMSKGACEILDQNHIPYTCFEKVEYIQNRQKNGLCPMEQRTQNISDPQQIIEITAEFLFEQNLITREEKEDALSKNA